MPLSRSSARLLQLLFGFAVSGLLIWLAFRNTPFRDVWDRIQAVHVAPMLLAVVVATLPFPLRVPRWRLLLRREDATALPSRPLWHAIAIGFAGNNILPFRLGELLRMGAITRLGPVPFPSALSSVAIERVIDALTAVTLLGIGLLFVELPVGVDLQSKATLVGVLCVVVLLAAMLVARYPALAILPIRKLIPAGKVQLTLIGIVERVVMGLGALRDPRRAMPVVLWSLVIWSVNAAAFWVAFGAFGIDVSFAGALILQGMLLVGIALPQAPGFAGGFEYAIWLALTQLFRVPSDLALAYAVTYHVTTFVPITVLGVWSLLSTGVTIKSAREVAV